MQKYEVTVDDDGTIRWRQQDKYHRLDGPAIERANGEKYWYIEGVRYFETQFLKKTQPVKEMTLQEIIAELGYEVKVVK